MFFSKQIVRIIEARDFGFYFLQKFRSSFWRLIGLNSSRKRRNKSWMLPPKDGSAHRACCASGGKPRADGRRPRGDGRRRHRHHYSNHNNNQCCRHRRLNDNEVNRGVSSPKLVNGDGCTKNKGSNNVTANGSITPNESCTCNRSTKSSKSGTNPLKYVVNIFGFILHLNENLIFRSTFFHFYNFVYQNLTTKAFWV